MKVALSLMFLTCTLAPLAADATASDLSIEGRLINVPDHTSCLLQVRKPIWEEAADDRELPQTFAMRIPLANRHEPVFVNITCGGYQVYVSKAVPVAQRALDLETVDGSRRLDVDECRELTGDEGKRAGAELRAAFLSEVKLLPDQFRAGRPRECETGTYVIVEALGRLSGPGQHWIVTKHKVGGQITVEQGI